MEKLPHYIIESQIIPFLSSNDLFYKFRSLSSYYYNCARNKILTHFPGEMMFILKKIIEFNTKEDLTKNFEEIMKKIFTEKKMLIVLMLQMNLSSTIKEILVSSTDQRALELISFFYIITQNEQMYNLLEQNNINEIKNISSSEQGHINIREKILNVLEEENMNFDLNEYRTVYESLDRDFLMQNNYANVLYNYIGLLLNFFSTKIQFNNIKNKMEFFFKQINDASEIWPKKRKFYEKSIDLVADTQILSIGAKSMLNLMKKFEIENDMTDYVYEKEEIKDFKNKENFDIIKNNRKKLNLAVIRIQQMFNFFEKCLCDKNKDNDSDYKNSKFKIGNWILDLKEFLYILSMIHKKYPINEYSFILTRNNLRHSILSSIYHLNLETIEKDNKTINEEKKEEIKDVTYNNVIINNKEKYNGEINNLKQIVESTKLAGNQLNESFKKISDDLNNINTSLI